MKKIKINELDEHNRKEYIDFIQKNPNSHIFHTVEWKEFIEKILAFPFESSEN